MPHLPFLVSQSGGTTGVPIRDCVVIGSRIGFDTFELGGDVELGATLV